LRIASELELPELHPGRAPPDVEIRYRPSARPPLAAADCWLDVIPGRVSVRHENIQFTIEGGRSVVVETRPETPPYDIRVWLLGSVMAALLHQRGYLPVHANVVATGNLVAAAFAGDSGAGKSTLATWFDANGHAVLADDLCAILPASDGTPQLFEGIPRVKLWGDSLTAFGRSSEGFEKVATGLDKFHVPMSRSRKEGSLRPRDLQRVYLLDRAPEGEPFRIVRQSGAEAARDILANAFRWELGQLIQGPRAQFDQCVAVARHAAVFRVRRRWGFDHFEEDARAIERHLAAPLDD